MFAEGLSACLRLRIITRLEGSSNWEMRLRGPFRAMSTPSLGLAQGGKQRLREVRTRSSPLIGTPQSQEAHPHSPNKWRECGLRTTRTGPLDEMQ